MLRKYRFFITGMALTMVLVLLCMYLPGKLVESQGKAQIGQIIRADQEYYADNVSAIDSLDFNIRPRLAMLSGQWKCDKTQVQAWEMGGQVVLDGEIRGFSGSVFLFFANYFWYTAMDYARQYGYSPWVFWDMDENAKTWLQLVAALSHKDIYEQIMEKLSQPECTLYKYSDSVLKTYEFYVWECAVKDDELGLDCSLSIDAVTLDIYSMHIGGRRFAGLPWGQAADDLSVDYDAFSDAFNDAFNNMEMSEYSSWLVIPSYLMLFTYGSMGNTVSAPGGYYSESSFERIAQKEPMFPGYSFRDGNYFFQDNLTYSIHESSGAFMFEDEEGCVIYGNIKDSNGLTWYLTSDPSYNFQ